MVLPEERGAVAHAADVDLRVDGAVRAATEVTGSHLPVMKHTAQDPVVHIRRHCSLRVHPDDCRDLCHDLLHDHRLGGYTGHSHHFAQEAEGVEGRSYTDCWPSKQYLE